MNVGRKLDFDEVRFAPERTSHRIQDEKGPESIHTAFLPRLDSCYERPVRALSFGTSLGVLNYSHPPTRLVAPQ